MKAKRLSLLVFAPLVAVGSLTAGQLVSREEFQAETGKNQTEFRNISVALAEIKNELAHMNRDLSELKICAGVCLTGWWIFFWPGVWPLAGPQLGGDGRMARMVRPHSR